MAKLFSKPLPQNHNLGLSGSVPDSISEENRHTEQAKIISTVPKWNRMNTVTRGPDIKAESKEVDSSIATRTSTRPARSTRSLAMTRDSEEAIVPQEVEKFSVVVGLGAPWPK